MPEPSAVPISAFTRRDVHYDAAAEAEAARAAAAAEHRAWFQDAEKVKAERAARDVIISERVADYVGAGPGGNTADQTPRERLIAHTAWLAMARAAAASARAKGDEVDEAVRRRDAALGQLQQLDLEVEVAHQQWLAGDQVEAPDSRAGEREGLLRKVATVEAMAKLGPAASFNIAVADARVTALEGVLTDIRIQVASAELAVPLGSRIELLLGEVGVLYGWVRSLDSLSGLWGSGRVATIDLPAPISGAPIRLSIAAADELVTIWRDILAQLAADPSAVIELPAEAPQPAATQTQSLWGTFFGRTS